MGKQKLLLKKPKQQLQATAVAKPIQREKQPDVESVSVSHIAHLQRTIGNRAAGLLLLQRKMSVGPVKDTLFIKSPIIL